MNMHNKLFFKHVRKRQLARESVGQDDLVRKIKIIFSLTRHVQNYVSTWEYFYTRILLCTGCSR